MLRPVEREDIPRIVELHHRVFGVPEGSTNLSPDLDYEEIFFNHPWFDPDLRSLMFEKDGALLGFMGIVVRPLRFGERRVRMAVPTRFMVDPERAGPLIAIKLLRALDTMPIDLAVNDCSNDAMRELWLRAGAEVFHLSSLRWSRPLRPAEWIRWRASRNPGAVGLIARWSRPATRIADLLARRIVPARLAARGKCRSVRTLDAARFLPMIEATGSRRSVRPVHDEASLRWQLGELERMGRPRRLRGGVVVDARDRDVGWYLYYLEPRGPAEVLQAGASPGREQEVFSCLLADAEEDGAIEVNGRSDPALLTALSHHRCAMKAGVPWSLVLSKDPALLAALQSGDAFFTRLEGEWW